MKYTILIISSLIYFNSFSQTEFIGIGETDTIYTREDLPNFVGQKILLIGKLRKGKIPTLETVDIQSPNIRGKKVIASGILCVVKPEEIPPGSANRGGAPIYWLKEEKIKTIRLWNFKGLR